MARRTKRIKTRKGEPFHPQSLNLHKFIRLILGPSIPDYKIAARWQMDGKNFHEFKVGRYRVPRIEKLVQLASVLDINKHLVFEVASGAPAQKIFELVKKDNISKHMEIKALLNRLKELGYDT